MASTITGSNAVRIRAAFVRSGCILKRSALPLSAYPVRDWPNAMPDTLASRYILSSIQSELFFDS